MTDIVPLEAAGHPFSLTVYRAEAPRGPVLVWAHGGAFMFGASDQGEGGEVALALSRRGISVLSVEYTLAPLDALPILLPAGPGAIPGGPPPGLDPDITRARFPVASLQFQEALAWAAEHADSLGADPALVAAGGSSAGAVLAVSAALRQRDQRGALPAALVLAYPPLHAVIPEAGPELSAMLESVPRFATFPPETIEAINRNYTDDPADPYAFPGGHDVRGLPRTLIATADADRLRASGEAFAAELALASVDVQLVRQRGTGHGYLNVPNTPAFTATIDRFAEWLLPQITG